LAQTRGKEVDRAAEETAQRSRSLSSEKAAELAAGIGETDGQNHHATERDADGRRPWEIPVGSRPREMEGKEESRELPARDPTGRLGQLLDLVG
jgi:hypothetical protein